MSHLVFTRLQSIVEQIELETSNNVEKRHSNKLERLRREKTKRGSPRSSLLDPVTNLSSRVLTEDERAALANGLHHVYPSEQFDQAQFICNIEYFYARLLNVRTAYQHYERRSADVVVRHELTSTQLHAASELRSMANTVRRTAQLEMKRVGKDHRRTFEVLRSLANDRSIVITRPDKGRGVVILDRAEYLTKMYAILDDAQSFRRIETDTTLLSEERLTNHLRRMKKEGFISEEEYSLARPVGSMPARIYGLPKLHKTNCPLRPVMSATKTVGYGLGKALTRRLEHLRRTPYVVKDTFDFVRRIQASGNTDKRMLSFDVTSLFTNVPLTFTIDLILDRLYPACTINCKDKPRTRQCKECYQRADFRILLQAATSETQFMFDGNIYVQHNGVAMGAPLAPIIADIFMAELETTLMDRLEQKGVREWHRYVDDTFVLVEPDTNIQEVLDVLNDFHPSIKFTYEVEKDDSLPFLDVRVTRSISANVFTTTIYRKPTFTGLMTNWNSFVPFSYKKASVVSMIQRALSVCSTYSLLDIELNKVRYYCQLNGYPRGFVDTLIGIGLTKYLNRNNNDQSDLPVAGCAKQRLFVEVPYIGNHTESIKKKIQHLTGSIRPDLDVRFVAKPPRAVQTFFPTKDPVPKHLQSNTVYATTCKECGDTYVGMTKRQTVTRLCEHGAPKNTFDQPNNNNNNSHVEREEPITVQQQTRPSRKTTTKEKAQQQQQPPLRRSSRIRDRAAALAIPVTNTNNDRQSDHTTTTKERTKNVDSSSAIAEHEEKNGHHMDWKNFRIVWRDNIVYRLLIKESLVIRAYEPRLNRTTNSVPLLVFPEGLERHLVPDPNG